VKPTSKNRKRDLVYRRIAHKPDVLIVARRDRAFHVHQISQAINTAKIWKEFAAMLPKGEWSYLLERFEEILGHHVSAFGKRHWERLSMSQFNQSSAVVLPVPPQHSLETL